MARKSDFPTKLSHRQIDIPVRCVLIILRLFSHPLEPDGISNSSKCSQPIKRKKKVSAAICLLISFSHETALLVRLNACKKLKADSASSRASYPFAYGSPTKFEFELQRIKVKLRQLTQQEGENAYSPQLQPLGGRGWTGWRKSALASISVCQNTGILAPNGRGFDRRTLASPMILLMKISMVQRGSDFGGLLHWSAP